MKHYFITYAHVPFGFFTRCLEAGSKQLKGKIKIFTN